MLCAHAEKGDPHCTSAAQMLLKIDIPDNKLQPIVKASALAQQVHSPSIMISCTGLQDPCDVSGLQRVSHVRKGM